MQSREKNIVLVVTDNLSFKKQLKKWEFGDGLGWGGGGGELRGEVEGQLIQDNVVDGSGGPVEGRRGVGDGGGRLLGVWGRGEGFR